MVKPATKWLRGLLRACKAQQRTATRLAKVLFGPVPAKPRAQPRSKPVVKTVVKTVVKPKARPTPRARPASDALPALAPAYNMHASLLPEFRGDAPVHWAVRHGATVTGASLHELDAGPDAEDGAIVSQMEVPILPDDTAWEVAAKVTVAAEQTLWRVLPSLLDGSAPRLRNDPAQGARFGPYTPEDGRIDWRQPARRV